MEKPDRNTIIGNLIGHLLEKSPDGFQAQLFFPWGPCVGAVRRGPVEGTYELLAAQVAAANGHKFELSSMFFLADSVMAISVVETSRVVRPDIDVSKIIGNAKISG